MIKINIQISQVLKIQIISKEELAFGEFEKFLFKAYIPGVVFIENKKFKSDFIVEHIESTKNQFKKIGKNFQIYEKWKGEIPQDFYHLFYSFVRQELLNNYKYPVHAACISNFKENILIVGHSGSGKTTSLLKLVKYKKVKIFSGNKTVVRFNNQGKLTACLGTRTITINKKSDNLKFKLNKYGYGKRNVFLLPEDCYVTKSQLVINKIVLVKLNAGVKECEKLSPLSAMHNLYPFFLDNVNADTIIFSGQQIFVGEVLTKIKKRLSLRLSLMTKIIPVYKVSGSLNYVCNKIINL